MRLSNSICNYVTLLEEKKIEVNVLAFFRHDILFPADVTVFQIGEARKRPGEAEKFPSSERFIYALETSTNEHPICCTKFLYFSGDVMRQTPRTASSDAAVMPAHSAANVAYDAATGAAVMKL